VCLGHQAIGAAFGGKIIRAQQLMHGKTSEITTTREACSPGCREVHVNRYHSLAIERESCPKELGHRVDDDGEIMGVRHTGAHDCHRRRAVPPRIHPHRARARDAEELPGADPP
jgi:anthranilate synthase component 2